MSRAWMPLYVADYLADTGHLSAAEHGAYLLLIMHYWQNGGLPNEDRRLARIARMSPDEWEAARETLFDLFEDGWRHHRIEAELQAAKQISEKAREKANRRWQGRSNAPAHAEADAAALPEQMPGQCQSQSPSSVVADAPTGSAVAPPEYPIDPTERLWAEGSDCLKAMGCADRESRSNIGRWRKAQPDPGILLDAIRRARDMGSRDPIALVTRLIQPTNGNRHELRPTVQDTARALADWTERVERGDTDVFGLGGGEGSDGTSRLLSQG